MIRQVCDVKDRPEIMQEALSSKVEVDITFQRPEPDELMDFRSSFLQLEAGVQQRLS